MYGLGRLFLKPGKMPFLLIKEKRVGHLINGKPVKN
jgi:hypothetical protein